MSDSVQKKPSLWSVDPATVIVDGYGSRQTLLTIMDRMRGLGHGENAIQWAIHLAAERGEITISAAERLPGDVVT